MAKDRAPSPHPLDGKLGPAPPRDATDLIVREMLRIRSQQRPGNSVPTVCPRCGQQFESRDAERQHEVEQHGRMDPA